MFLATLGASGHSRLPQMSSGLRHPEPPPPAPQAVSRSPSQCRRYTVVTASELWSRKRLTCSIDSPAHVAVWLPSAGRCGRRLAAAPPP